MKGHLWGLLLRTHHQLQNVTAFQKNTSNLYQEQTYLFFLFQNIPNGENLKTQYKLKVS